MTQGVNELINGKQVIRVRAIIVHEERLMVVRHPQNIEYAALPGGHLDFGEDPVACIRRELMEELGVEPVVGRLLYVHTFTTERDGGAVQSVEFFFMIDNPADFLALPTANPTHSHEVAVVEWVDAHGAGALRPASLAADFAAGTLMASGVRFIDT